MTCIVALEKDGIAYLGSDSFLGGAYIRDQIDRPKFFKKGERFYIAFAGGLRGAQIVEHELTFRKMRKNEDEEAYLVTEVSKKLKEQFVKSGANIKDDGNIDTHDSQFIVCISGKVFIIQEDYSIIRSRHGFTAIGAGQEFALGAMAVLQKQNLEPKKAINYALEVAANLSPQVCGPFHIIEV